MDHGIGGVDKAIIITLFEPELRRCKIAAKNPNLRLEVFVEFRKRHVQLQGVPQAQLCIARIATAHQQIQSRIMLFEQIGCDMRADVAGATGQEYCHVAPFVPVLILSPSPFSAAGDMCNSRGARASSGRPSISGYVHRRNAGI